MKRGKPKPDLVIYLRRRFPEDVPTHALADVVAALQGILEPVSPKDQPPSVSVFDIKRGSAAYQCTISNPDVAIPRFRLVGKCIQSEHTDRVLGEVFPYISRLSEAARRIQTDVEIREGADKNGPVILRVSPDTFEQLKEYHTVAGATTIVGKVLRVGGSTEPRCMVRILNQKTAVFCTISVEQARHLATRLYETVALEGRAVWLKSTRDVLYFDVSNILPYQRTSFAEIRQKLRAAGASRWDHQKLDKEDEPLARVH
ncbi:MAG: hypothetical protein FWE88_01840 [Phycisphaerae bacterium]|nr:hypothetical protein [Phycisphaerae bacterium]